MTTAADLIKESKELTDLSSNKKLSDFFDKCFEDTKRYALEYLAGVRSGTTERNRAVWKEDYEDKGLISIPIHSWMFFKFADLATIISFGVEDKNKRMVMKSWVWQLFCNKLPEQFPDAEFIFRQIGNLSFLGDCEIIIKDEGLEQ